MRNTITRGLTPLARRAGLAIVCALGLAAASAQAEEKTCGEFGTSVQFEKTPSDAARKALKQEKLVFVLHVSGNFEEPEFT